MVCWDKSPLVSPTFQTRSSSTVPPGTQFKILVVAPASGKRPVLWSSKTREGVVTLAPQVMSSSEQEKVARLLRQLGSPGAGREHQEQPWAEQEEHVCRLGHTFPSMISWVWRGWVHHVHCTAGALHLLVLLAHPPVGLTGVEAPPTATGPGRGRVHCPHTRAQRCGEMAVVVAPEICLDVPKNCKTWEVGCHLGRHIQDEGTSCSPLSGGSPHRMRWRHRG